MDEHDNAELQIEAKVAARSAFLVQGQATVRCRLAAGLFKQEDGPNSQQRQISSRLAVAHATVVLVPGAIAAVMLAILNGPLPAQGVEQNETAAFLPWQAASRRSICTYIVL